MVSLVCRDCRITGAMMCALLMGVTVALTLLTGMRFSQRGKNCRHVLLVLDCLILSHQVILCYLFSNISHFFAQNLVVFIDVDEDINHDRGEEQNDVPLDDAVFEVRCARCGSELDGANIWRDRDSDSEFDDEFEDDSGMSTDNDETDDDETYDEDEPNDF